MKFAPKLEMSRLEAAILGIVGVAALVWAASILQPHEEWSEPTRTDVPAYAAFCTHPLKAAVVTDDEVANRRFSARVPEADPAPGQATIEGLVVEFNDVVSIVATTNREGVLAIHGLTEPYLVKPRQSVHLRFRAAVSGRFPLHFHGPAGEHFEIAAIEVQPPK
jgi:hypothetical protein